MSGHGMGGPPAGHGAPHHPNWVNTAITLGIIAIVALVGGIALILLTTSGGGSEDEDPLASTGTGSDTTTAEPASGVDNDGSDIGGSDGGSGEDAGGETAAELGAETLETTYSSDLEQGQCILDPDNDTVVRVDVVDCSGWYDFEVYYVGAIAEEWPGDAEAQNLGEQACHEEFETYIGRAFDDSELNVNHLVPTEDSWAGNQDVACMVSEPGGPTQGSLAGADR